MISTRVHCFGPLRFALINSCCALMPPIRVISCSMMPRSRLRQSPGGPFLVSGVSPRTRDTGLTHSSEMPFMSMAVNKYMAKQCPTHLHSTFVMRRGVVDRVHRDCRNGPTHSSIVALTESKPGEGLLVQDSVGSTCLSFRGRELIGTVFSLEQPFIFDARKRLHAGYILPTTVASSRITLVTFASIHCSTLSDPVRCSLLRLGFPVPSLTAIQRALYGCDR